MPLPERKPLNIAIVPQPDGTFFASVAELPGVTARGDTVHEVQVAIVKPAQAYLDLLAR